MADFCQQCSFDYFGKDFEDFKGATSPAEDKAGYAAVVLCEGCGAIQVDSEGRCITADCLKGGHKDGANKEVS